MQKHRDDPATVPSRPTVGDPREGFQQDIDKEKSREGDRKGRPQPRRPSGRGRGKK
jgi:hypothetical protein